MDITKHLTKPSPFASPNEKLDFNDLGFDEASSSPGASQTSTSRSSSVVSETPPESHLQSAKGKEKAKARKRVRRDHWTRWPLLLHDVLKPEWTLEDEVAVVASQVLKVHPINHPVAVVPDDDDEVEDQFLELDMEVEEDDPDPPYYVPPLTYITAEFLSTILSNLASFTPARPASMQNRVEPLGWRSVIDAVVSCRNPAFLDPT